jgi:hypothetical protein
MTDSTQKITAQNIKEIIPALNDFFVKYPIRNVLMQFKGRYGERFADGTGVASDSHIVTHKVVELRKKNGHASGLYLCDTQEDCVLYSNYCGMDSSLITMNEFDENINPKKISAFLEKQNPNKILHLNDIFKTFGVKDRWGDFNLRFPANGNLILRAMSKGGSDCGKFNREEYKMTNLYFNLEDKFQISDCSTLPYEEVAGFIRNLRSAYQTKHEGGKK